MKGLLQCYFSWGQLCYLVYSEKVLDFCFQISSFKLWVVNLLTSSKEKWRALATFLLCYTIHLAWKDKAKWLPCMQQFALWIIQMLFLSLLMARWCPNQLKQIKAGNKLIWFSISLAESLIENSCRFASPSHWRLAGCWIWCHWIPNLLYQGFWHFTARTAACGASMFQIMSHSARYSFFCNPLAACCHHSCGSNIYQKEVTSPCCCMP